MLSPSSSMISGNLEKIKTFCAGGDMLFQKLNVYHRHKSITKEFCNESTAGTQPSVRDALSKRRHLICGEFQMILGLQPSALRRFTNPTTITTFTINCGRPQSLPTGKSATIQMVCHLQQPPIITTSVYPTHHATHPLHANPQTPTCRL